MNVLKAKVNGEWVAVSGPTGPAGAGVATGGTTNQILTKKSATNYDTQWTTPTIPILPNNTYLQGYKADATTPQNLLGMGTDDNIYLGHTLPSPRNIIIPDGVAVRSVSGFNFLYADTAASTIHFAPYTTDQNIYIGGGLPASKSIYVPRLHSFGPITLFNNNTYFQGTRSDGNTRQDLIGIGGDNSIYIGAGLGVSERVVFPGVWIVARRADATHQHLVSLDPSNDNVNFAYQSRNNIWIGSSGLGDINIGSGLTAGKNVIVPRLIVQGPVQAYEFIVATDNWIKSTTGHLIAAPSNNGNIYFSEINDCQFNNQGGSTRFKRNTYFSGDATMDINLFVAGTIYRSGIGPYNFPDFVFEHAFTGKIERYSEAPGANTYKGLWPLDRVKDFVRENWRLPGHAPREDNRVDIFRRTHDMLAELERVYLHLFELNERIMALEEG